MLQLVYSQGNLGIISKINTA